MKNINNLDEWLITTPLGRQILIEEHLFFSRSLKNTFGHYAIQLGLPFINFLDHSQIINHYVTSFNDSSPNINLRCQSNTLPFATESIDLVLCCHIFETLEDTNQCLSLIKECERILAPNGKIIILAFNRLSFFGLFVNHKDFKNFKLTLSYTELKNLLYETSLYVNGGKFFNYLPPLNENILAKLGFLNKIGDRWGPSFSNVYAIIAQKNEVTTNLIGPISEANNISQLEKLAPKICQKDY